MLPKQFTELIDKLIFSTLNRGVEEFQEIIGNKLLEYQTQEYRRSKFVKSLLYTLKPVELEKIYVPISINDHRGKEIKIDSIGSLLSSSNYVTLIGDAGSGKSTLIKYLFLNIIKEGSYIPINFELRYLNYSNTNFITETNTSRIHGYLVENIIKASKIKNYDSSIERLLNSGKLIIFFDGLDELKKSLRSEILKEIDSFVKKYPNNSYVLTSRPSSNAESLPLFYTFEISPLNEKQIKELIKRQIIEEELKQKIIDSISNKKNVQYIYLLNNPLLLTLFILTYQINSNLPEKKSSYYRQVFDALFTRHDSISKLGFDREKLCGLEKEKYESILEQFSIITFFERRFAFEEDYFIEILKRIRASDNDFSAYEIGDLIEDLTVSIGIIQKDGLYYVFPHRSLQEYFAVLFIKKMEKKSLKEKAYLKIFERGLVNELNFLSLCRELDFYNMTKYFTVPHLEKFVYIFKLDEIFRLYDHSIKMTSEERKKVVDKREKTIWEVFNHFFDKIEVRIVPDEYNLHVVLEDFIMNSYKKSENYHLFQFLLQPTNLSGWIGLSLEEDLNSIGEFLTLEKGNNTSDITKTSVLFEEVQDLCGTYNIENYQTWKYLCERTIIRGFTVDLIQEICDKVTKMKKQLSDFDQKNDSILELL